MLPSTPCLPLPRCLPDPAATREVDKKHLPPVEVMASVDVQELNRLFVNSGRLDSEAIVLFVKTLSAISAEELRPVACPRVFSLTKIVEIAHFNMGRIRWGQPARGRPATPAACRRQQQACHSRGAGNHEEEGSWAPCLPDLGAGWHPEPDPISPNHPAARQAGVEPHLGGAGRLLHRGGVPPQPVGGDVRGGLAAPAGNEVPGAR